MSNRLATPPKQAIGSLCIAVLLVLLLPVSQLYGQLAGPINLQIVSTSSTCGLANGVITITASNGTLPYLYSLSGGLPQTSNVFGGLIAGNYTVTVTDAAMPAQTVTGSTVVQDIAGPTFSVNTLPATCANNDGTITIVPMGGTLPFQYQINGGNIQLSPIFPNLPTGIRTFTTTDANGCIASEPVDVPLNNDLTLNVTSSLTDCDGTGVRLPAISNGTTFSWTPVAGLDNPAALNPVAAPSVTTLYTIEASKGICVLTSLITVTVFPVPVAETAAGITTCYGKSVQLQGSAQGPSGAGLTYNWSPAEYLDNPASQEPTVIQPKRTITYQLRVTNTSGCTSVNPASETITVTPPPKVFAGDDTSVVVGQAVPLNAIDVDNIGFTQYQWTPAEGLSNANISDPVATLTSSESITYLLVATTAEGCEGVDSVTIKSFAFADIFVPDAFTPNHDGHNDVLRALPKGITEFKYFNVYNRWGQLVFASSNATTGWDGTVNGRTQEPGVFVWMAMGLDISGRVIQRKGTVILLR